MLNLDKKRVLIIGASSGIGKSTAVLCSKLGAKLVLSSRNMNKLNNVLKELDGEGHSVIEMDFSKPNEILKFMKIVCQNEKLDAMVYCVGMEFRLPLPLLDYVKSLELMNTNFFSFIETVKCFSSIKNSNKNSSIVGVSSIASLRGNATQTMYSSSKAAMDAAVRCLAVELAARCIRINTVAPGYTNTNMFAKIKDQFGSFIQPALDKQILGLIDPDSVASTIIFLLSDASKFITGQTLPVDAGGLL
jgi:NAD(P)-dependent dehydrogenase (short-subunit alcohol dehydrogenase family)